MENELEERLLAAWIGLNALLKDSRMTRELTYNEAVVMKAVYDGYRADGVGRTAFQVLLRETGMLKSQLNRTVDSLCRQGYLEKERSGEDGRRLYLRPRPERLPDFLAVHARSLEMARAILQVIGEEDGERFAGICEKLLRSGLKF